MGEDNAYPEETPAHDVMVSGFWIHEYAVTNGDFAGFVKATNTVPSPNARSIRLPIPAYSPPAAPCSSTNR